MSNGQVYGRAYAVVPESVLYAAVSANAKVLWAILQRHADPEGHCYPSNRRLAHLMEVSEGTVIRAKKELVTAQLLAVAERFDDSGRRTTDDLYLQGAPPKSARGVGRKSGGTRTNAILNEKTTYATPRKNAPQASQPADDQNGDFWVAGHHFENGKLSPFDRARGLNSVRALRRQPEVRHDSLGLPEAAQ